MRPSSRFLAISLPLLLILSGAALADTCNNFASYTCAKHTNDIVHVGGLGATASGQSVGILLNSNMFNITTANGDSGSDVIILAAFANGAPTGTLNGISFNSLNTFPEGGATGAITDSLQGLGFCGTTCNLQFGYVDLGTALAANGTVNITAAGVPAGTVFYAEVLNSEGQIVYITPNSEAGILGRGVSTVPEPGSISLMITGLCGIAGGAWRKLRG
jgi:hypothetical protein